jgi:putative ABC transport system permease protein
MDWRARVREALPVVTGDPRRDAEIVEELAGHCADRYGQLRAAGRTEDEAVRQVASELRETARRAGHLGRAAAPAGPHAPAGGPGWPARLRQDLSYAARLLRRGPGFAVAAVLTLALAIGAVTAIFSVVHGVLLAPLPYPRPDRLVFVWEVSPRGADHNVVSSGNFLDWRDRARSFDRLGAYQDADNVALTGVGTPRRVRQSRATPEVFAALGVVPERGRLFTDRDAIPDAPRVVLVTDRFYRTVLAGAPAVLDRAITLDGLDYRIIGVLPPSALTATEPSSDVVTPIRFDASDRDERRSHNFYVIGRLKPGVTVAAANADMRTLAAALTAEHPKDLTNWSVSVVPVHADLVRSVRPLLTVLMGVVVVVLVMACLNLANLQLARAAGRHAELAVRSAIGAGRRRLFTQLLTESLLLVLAGGTAGVGLVALLMRTLVAAAPPDIPLLDAVTVDWSVLAFAAAVSVTSAVLAGLLPALQASRADVRPLLHGGRAGVQPAQARLRLVLVSIQVALALVLLVGAALLVRSFERLQAVDAGFDRTNLVTVEMDLPGARYPDRPTQVGFYEGVLGRIQAAHGVVAAAGTTGRPGEGAGMTFSFAIEGRKAPNPTGREDPEPLQAISPAYFETMRIPVVRGRVFTGSDRAATTPVAVINEALARLHWPGQNPVGQRICFRPGQLPWREIVGVVADTHDEGLDRPAPPTVYVPFAQATWTWMTWQTFVIRTDAGPASVVPAVQAAVWARDTDLPLLKVSTMAAAFAENDARRRFAMQLLIGCAGLALLLGAVGIYGVLACGVSERRREIGIRLALGARPGQVVVSVARRPIIFALAGVAAGTGAALVLTRFLRALLFDVPPADPVAFSAMAIFLLAVAAGAAWVPVRRALRLDPVAVLRES